MKTKIETEINDAEGKLRANPKFYHGFDWWHLSEEEESVFGIERERWPRMMTVWHAYEEVIGVSYSGIFDFTEKEVSEARWRCGLSCAHSLKEFGAFGKEYGDLRYRESKAVYEKMKFWSMRRGLTTFPDDE